MRLDEFGIRIGERLEEQALDKGVENARGGDRRCQAIAAPSVVDAAEVARDPFALPVGGASY
jgi:hypothetical protein